MKRTKGEELWEEKDQVTNLKKKKQGGSGKGEKIIFWEHIPDIRQEILGNLFWVDSLTGRYVASPKDIRESNIPHPREAYPNISNEEAQKMMRSLVTAIRITNIENFGLYSLKNNIKDWYPNIFCVEVIGEKETLTPDLYNDETGKIVKCPLLPMVSTYRFQICKMDPLEFKKAIPKKWWKEVKSLTVYNCDLKYEEDSSDSDSDEEEIYKGVLDIGYLQNLQFLDCIQTFLAKLDIGKNTSLKRLECHDCRMDELNIRNNINLEYLECHSNNLTVLDIGKNTLLEYLDCALNELTVLNTENNPLLKYLYCRVNGLKRLNLTNNINLEYLDCSANGFTTLNVNRNTQLKSLDISYNVFFFQVNLRNNPNLKFFRCVHNHLVKLDLSQNPNLEKVDCRENPINFIYTCIRIPHLSRPDDAKLIILGPPGERVHIQGEIDQLTTEAKVVSYFPTPVLSIHTLKL